MRRPRPRRPVAVYRHLVDAVSVTGLQGTCKTTLAKDLGMAIDAVVFSRDPLMDVLLAGGVPAESDEAVGAKGVGQMGYELQTALLREQLSMGRSVVLECVVGWEMRAEWKRVALEQGARFWLVDTVCSDVEVHRRRFVERGPVQRGDWVSAWETVEANRDRFVVHPEAAFVADATVPLAENVSAIVDLIRSAA
jgi:predicted kinase